MSRLKELLDATGLSMDRWAELLHVDRALFDDFVHDRRPLPPGLRQLLRGSLGVDPTASAGGPPAVWFKLRAAEVTEQDLSVVALSRRFGQHVAEAEALRGTANEGWKTCFAEVLNRVDREASFPEQGRSAARAFRALRSLNAGAGPIGDVLRGALRSLGLVVLEAPIAGSRVEGLCYWLTPAGASRRPCLFANSYRSTWFRRNAVLAHELCHAIFELDAEAALYDFDSPHDADVDRSGLEERARAFEQELLLPLQVLTAVSQRLSVDWGRLTAAKLAALVAGTEVEQMLVLRSAVDARLIDESAAAQYRELDIADDLKACSSHALSTREWVAQSFGLEQPPAFLTRRRIANSETSFSIPSHFVREVVDLWNTNQISTGKAAQMLMIEEGDVYSRFEELATSSASL